MQQTKAPGGVEATAEGTDREESSTMTEGTPTVEQLYRQHRRDLVNIAAARWARSHHDAEDAVQEAFVTALTEYETVAPVNPRAWLVAITRHRALAGTASATRATPAGDTLDELPAPDGEDQTTNDGLCMGDPDTALYVLAALQELSPRLREALTLWALDGLSWAEVAEQMGVTVRSARWNAYESLRRLRAS